MSNEFFGAPLYCGMARTPDRDGDAGTVLRHPSPVHPKTTRDDCVRLQMDLRRLVDGPVESRHNLFRAIREQS
jgi:hypothetical protein